MTLKRYSKDAELEIPEEFNDVIRVLEMGAIKYGANSWLKGIHFNHRDNHASMSRHLAEAYVGQTKDAESGLHPLLHLATRALMEYTLDTRYSKGEEAAKVELDEEQLRRLYKVGVIK